MNDHGTVSDAPLIGAKASWSEDKRIPFVLFGLVLLSRAIAWPFSDVVDADAVTRALLGESYMLYPGWGGDGIWPPLHFYLNGIFTVVVDNRAIASVWVNILLGSAMVLPVFALVRRWSNGLVAIAVTILVVFNPLMFRNSLQGLSEIPFLFFSACAFNAASCAQTGASTEGSREALLAGLFITIACGMRYEAWLFIVAIAGILLLARHWRRTILFCLTASMFPIAWMVTNHLAQGNMFHGVEHVVHWRGNAEVVHVPDGERWLRTLFFPVSFLLALTPATFLLGMAGGVRSIARGSDPLARSGWLLLFPLFLIIMITKARNAELLLQHRFTMTLILLFIPFLVLGFKPIRPSLLIVAMSVVFAGWSMWSSMDSAAGTWLSNVSRGTKAEYAIYHIRTYTLHEMKAIPQLDHRKPDELVKRIDAIPITNKLLVLDFFGWQDTYNVALRVDVLATSVVFLPEDGSSSSRGLRHLEDYLDRLSDPKGILVLKAESVYHKALQPMAEGGVVIPLQRSHLLLEPAGDVEDLHLFTFRQELK
jgi:hypothetical protein